MKHIALKPAGILFRHAFCFPSLFLCTLLYRAWVTILGLLPCLSLHKIRLYGASNISSHKSETHLSVDIVEGSTPMGRTLEIGLFNKIVGVGTFHGPPASVLTVTAGAAGCPICPAGEHTLLLTRRGVHLTRLNSSGLAAQQRDADLLWQGLILLVHTDDV